MAKVLIGCETSGIVREAFAARGHDVWSCDLLPADGPTNRHIRGDIRDVMMMDDWDLMAVMHPPCTRLTNSGVRWLTAPPKMRQPDYPAAYDGWTEEERLAYMWRSLDDGAALFSAVWNVAHIPCDYEPPAQSVQPWQFGTDPDGPDNEKKRTCLWLRSLPRLDPTGTLDGSSARDSVHKASPGPDRWKLRSKFFPGIAAAMADQWGSHAEGIYRARAA
ncbi:MAG: hypothetical protein IE919_18625 [Thioclava sp.]|nr:hypothetical protein [Thioclava sp.]MBD3805231.1 hypothetical protein [Thioclava sp.]